MTYIAGWVVNEVRDDTDDDKLIFSLYKEGCVCGKAEIEILYGSYDYEFMNILSESEFNKIFGEEPIVKVSLLEIEPEYRGVGAASYLLGEVFYRLRLAGFTQWFLNASPLDENGLTLFQLEKFYSKYGFVKEQIRDESTLMWFKDEIS